MKNTDIGTMPPPGLLQDMSNVSVAWMQQMMAQSQAQQQAIAQLSQQLAANQAATLQLQQQAAQLAATPKRGPGRPRKHAKEVMHTQVACDALTFVLHRLTSPYTSIVHHRQGHRTLCHQ